MAQPFSLRHPLIDFHGNYGSKDYPAAAEALHGMPPRNSRDAHAAASDEDTVDFRATTRTSSRSRRSAVPVPEPAGQRQPGHRRPMATNIPPHNLGEVIDGTLPPDRQPEATADDLMKFIKGPRLPDGRVILGRSGIIEAYRTGSGSIRMRRGPRSGDETGGAQIVVTELPYQGGRQRTASSKGRRGSSTPGSSTDPRHPEPVVGRRHQDRLTVEARRQRQRRASKPVQQTGLQTSFGVNMVALVDGVPRPLNLVQMLQHYIDTGRRHHPAFEVPVAEGAGPGPHRRGPAEGARHDRRHHHVDPGSDDPSGGARGPEGRPFEFSEIQGTTSST